jgi:uncharacterized protein (DUF427 family)
VSSSLENRRIPAGDPAGSAWREAPVAVLPTRRRLRNVFNGRTIVDTTSALILFEHDHLPVYYVPVADLDAGALVPSDKASHCPRKGDASYWSIVVGDRTAPDAVWGYETNPVEGAPDLSGYRAFYWNAVDHWYEEDEEVFVHARDPFKRIDALRSSRHVRVEIDGVVLADTHRPTLLFETGIDTRYYIPRADLELELLRPSARESACPYKGTAGYYSAIVGDRVVEDIAWTYTHPIAEIPKIEQLVAFFDEHVDTYVDGELQPRPASAWS